ncbi:hypothetical protein PF011_g22055 [Phytophthora fragariae]|uniref:Protein kinase domain-containing protein n=1 Tax=Phytophthora fragariae TaxID=53985 RepID=A0A6A3IH83_9STRA|nr:hypothetical protein PF011_g22055 [Phytophthora fragariae]
MHVWCAAPSRLHAATPHTVLGTLACKPAALAGGSSLCTVQHCSSSALDRQQDGSAESQACVGLDTGGSLPLLQHSLAESAAPCLRTPERLVKPLSFPVPGLRGSLSRDALAAISRRLQRLPECDVWSRRLHARLRSSHEAVAAHEDEQWRVQYCDVLKRFINLLRAKPLLERLAGAESIAYTFQELNSKLDEICVGVGAMDSSAQGQWQTHWARNCQVQATQLEAQVQATDPSLIIRQLRGEKEVTKVMLDMSSSLEADPSTRLADLKRATLERLRLYLGLDTSANVAERNFKWYIPERGVEIGEPIYTVEEWVVSRAKWRSRSGVVQDVTVKTLFDAVDVVSESVLVTQIRLWYELPGHPNIVKLYGGSHLARKPFLAYKDAPHSDIFQFFRQEENREVFWSTFVGVAEGLTFLHEHKIVYGGLTSRSILVSADNTPQISDLDCSYVRSVSGRLSRKTYDVLMSRLRWTPRERLLDAIPDDPQYKSEIYSLGMCIIEAMTQVVPFGLIADEDVMEKIIDGEPYERPAEASDKEWGVISRLIAADVG